MQRLQDAALEAHEVWDELEGAQGWAWTEESFSNF